MTFISKIPGAHGADDQPPGVHRLFHLLEIRRRELINCNSIPVSYTHLDVYKRQVQKAITESTNGRAKMEKDREMYFAVLDGEVLTFEE